MLVIDGIKNVTMANGLVRIQVAQVGADGKSKGVEEIAIPASQYGAVVQALTQAGQNLRQRLEEQQVGHEQQTSQQAPEPEHSDQGDNFQF
jgi:hypothetical protein